MGYLDGFLVTLRQHRLFGGERVTKNYSGGRMARSSCAGRKHGTPGDELAPPDAPDDDKSPKPDRLHGRHVLNRYEDGMEKCIGCELCAGVCPAKCIYVRGADNDPDDPTSPGERFGFVYEINYLRCIHCDLCVEACPTEAITESKLFEFSFTNRQDAIYTKAELRRRRRRQAAADAVGGLARGRGRAHERLDAGHGAVRRRRLRRRGRLERRARLRRARRRAAAETRRRSTPSGERRAATSASDGERRRAAATRRPLMELVVFVVASAMVLGGAVGVVVRTNPVHAALSLVLTLFGVAVHFVAHGGALPRRRAGHRLRRRDRRAVPVRDHAARRRPAEDLRIEPLPIQRPLAAVIGRRHRRPADRGDRRRPATSAAAGRRAASRPASPTDGDRRTTPTSASSPTTCSATTCSPSS